MRERFDKRTEKLYKTWHFSTSTSTYFTHYYNMFYTDIIKVGYKKKIVPINIEELLTPALTFGFTFLYILYLFKGIFADNLVYLDYYNFSNFGFMFFRGFSSINKSYAENTENLLIPKKSYLNSDTEKENIIKENKNLCGIYR